MKPSIRHHVITIFVAFSTIGVNANEQDFIPVPSLPITENEPETKPGFSIQNPIVITEKDLNKAKKLIEQHIKKNYPDYEIISNLTSLMPNGCDVEIYTIKKGNESIRLYFGIRAAINALREKYKEEIEQDAKDDPEPEANPEPEPGYSLQKPIIIPETDLGEADKLIRERIKEVYPQYHIASTVRTENNKRTIDIYTIEKGGESIKLYFDVQIAMDASREKQKE